MPRTRRLRGENGQGSIYLRRDVNLWAASVSIPNEFPDGRRYRKVSYHKTRQEARRALNDILARMHGGAVVKQRDHTVEQLAREWLAFKQGQVRPVTLRRYEALLRLYVVPKYGRTRALDLTPGMLSELYQQLLRTGLSSNTVGHAHAACRVMLAYAVRCGYLQRNVASMTKPPPLVRRKRTVFDAEQSNDFKTAVMGDPLEAYWLLLITTGMRSSEALGLQWQDLQLVKRPHTARIVRTVTDAPTGFEVGEPKTSRSRRIVPLTPEATRSLSRMSRGLPTDWIFRKPDGDPYAPGPMTRRLRPILERAGLPTTLTVHDLRHSVVSIGLAAGVPVAAMSELVGHSSPYVTWSVYSHALPNATVNAVDVISRAMKRKS